MLGGTEKSTVDEFVRIMGNTTKMVFDNKKSQGRKIQQALMSAEDIIQMDEKKGNCTNRKSESIYLRKNQIKK